MGSLASMARTVSGRDTLQIDQAGALRSGMESTAIWAIHQRHVTCRARARLSMSLTSTDGRPSSWAAS